MHHVNILAVLGATIAGSFVGGIWYSPALFAKAWLQECGLKEADLRARNQLVLFGGAIALTFIISLIFALCIGPNPGVGLGVTAGLVVGVFWVSASIGMNYLFEGKSLKLFAITAGHHILKFAVIGLIIGLWN
jgi:hypothetical protein